jgi:hypothetical protein
VVEASHPKSVGKQLLEGGDSVGRATGLPAPYGKGQVDRDLRFD